MVSRGKGSQPLSSKSWGMGFNYHIIRMLNFGSGKTPIRPAALLKDLKQQGLSEDTLVIWGVEFRRTSFSQGQLTETNYGQNHHLGCFTM